MPRVFDHLPSLVELHHNLLNHQSRRERKRRKIRKHERSRGKERAAIPVLTKNLAGITTLKYMPGVKDVVMEINAVLTILSSYQRRPSRR